MSNKKLIRNSTSEFLMFTAQNAENSIEARYENETVWLTQKFMAKLFEVNVSTINEHIKNVYQNEELIKNSTIGEFPIVQIRLFESNFDNEFIKKIHGDDCHG